MIQFTPFTSNIKASERRIVSLWCGQASHLNLSSEPDFSGTVTVIALFSLTARMQYYVMFYSEEQNVIENWRVEPSDIRITGVEAYETELLNMLKSMNIQMNRIMPENPNYSRLLRRLPLEFSAANEAFQVDFDIFNKMTDNSKLDENEIDTIKKLCSLL